MQENECASPGDSFGPDIVTWVEPELASSHVGMLQPEDDRMDNADNIGNYADNEHHTAQNEEGIFHFLAHYITSALWSCVAA